MAETISARSPSIALPSRRQFLASSVLAAAAGYLPTVWTGRAFGSANSDVRVAVIGFRGQGGGHLSQLQKIPGVRITALCDVDENVLRAGVAAMQKKGIQVEGYQDIRKLLENKNVDAVSIATPNHWHVLASYWAVQAGRDVYVEKPISHNVWEGRQLVRAAQQYGRLVQCGTQSRSTVGLMQAVRWSQQGHLGKLLWVRGTCYKRRPSIGKVEGDQPIPPGIDYDLWCGPAPMKPLRRKRLHYDWHWIWDTGNGDLGNQGIHQMDIARWGLGKNELARSVISVGGRFGYIDDGETANTQICVFDYGNSELIFEVRGLETEKLLGTAIGNIFYGSKGYLVCSSSGTAVAFSPKGEQLRQFKGDENHFGNFIKAVRQRDASILKSDILEGHLSSALCHLGNISYILGTEQPFIKKTRAFGNDKEAYETLARMEQHLRDNQVPLDKTCYRVGRRLTVDPRTETFVNDSQANALLTRKPRPPFVVPEKV
jgi:predicted dehydrogenase